MTWDSSWEDIFRSRAWGKYPGEELIRFVAINFYQSPHRSNIRLLEVGCGPGANLWFCAREGFAVHGIDGSPHAITLARQRLDQECPGWQGSIDVGDFINIKYPDAHFDAVIDNESVCHNDFIASCAVYREIARTLRSGGKLFVRTFATGTTGDCTGEPLGWRSWRVAEGPMLGKGLSRFTAESDFQELFGPELTVHSCDMLVRTVANRTQTIREWILVLEKGGRALAR